MPGRIVIFNLVGKQSENKKSFVGGSSVPQLKLGVRTHNWSWRQAHTCKAVGFVIDY